MVSKACRVCVQVWLLWCQSLRVVKVVAEHHLTYGQARWAQASLAHSSSSPGESPSRPLSPSLSASLPKLSFRHSFWVADGAHPSEEDRPSTTLTATSEHGSLSRATPLAPKLSSAELPVAGPPATVEEPGAREEAPAALEAPANAAPSEEPPTREVAESNEESVQSGPGQGTPASTQKHPRGANAASATAHADHATSFVLSSRTFQPAAAPHGLLVRQATPPAAPHYCSLASSSPSRGRTYPRQALPLSRTPPRSSGGLFGMSSPSRLQASPGLASSRSLPALSSARGTGGAKKKRGTDSEMLLKEGLAASSKLLARFTQESEELQAQIAALQERVAAHRASAPLPPLTPAAAPAAVDVHVEAAAPVFMTEDGAAS